MLNEIKIKCFLLLAENLSFTETAKMLDMTQQAVSKNIAGLEKELNLPLFLRSRYFVRLTQAGKEWYRFFFEYEKKFQAAKKDIQKRYEVRPILYIGYQNYMNFGSALPQAMAYMREKAPEVDLAVERQSPALLRERLLDRQLNLILICDRFAPLNSGLKRLELVKVPLVLVVAASHPGVREGATFRDFAKEPFVIDAFEKESALDCGRRTQREIELCELEPVRVITVPNRDSAYTAAELGQGVLISTGLSRFAFHENLRAYSVGKDDMLCCVWWGNEENHAIEIYAKQLKEAYQAEPPLW